MKIIYLCVVSVSDTLLPPPAGRPGQTILLFVPNNNFWGSESYVCINKHCPLRQHDTINLFTFPFGFKCTLLPTFYVTAVPLNSIDRLQ